MSSVRVAGIKGEMGLGSIALNPSLIIFLTFKIEMPYRKAALFLQFIVSDFLKILSKGILSIVKKFW